MFVLQKDGRSRTTGNSLFRNGDGQLCVWYSEDRAIEFSLSKKSSWETWRVRPAISSDYSSIAKQLKKFKFYLKPFVVMDKEMDVAKKASSVNCLVDVFEDFDKRKFAISSKASSEQEFIVEVSQAISGGTSDWDIRLRELLPLVVDMCCKYRGYKAETVFERRELVAGDLEMPKQ